MGAAGGLLGQRLAATSGLRLGRPFDLVESKLRSPSARPGIVSRHALVDRLLAAPSAPVIGLVAPPGYGKTTLLAQWSARKGPRVGWVSVDRRDNGPVVLLRYLAAALDRLEPLDPQVFGALASPGVSVLATVLPRLLAAVSAMTRPVALVLDNLELVVALVFPTFTGGRVDTVLRWLGWFEERGLVERYPPVAVLGAWIQALVGRPTAADRWAAAAEFAMTAPDTDTAAQTPPDDSTTESYLAMCVDCCAMTASVGCGPTPRLPWLG